MSVVDLTKYRTNRELKAVLLQRQAALRDLILKSTDENWTALYEARLWRVEKELKELNEVRLLDEVREESD